MIRAGGLVLMIPALSACGQTYEEKRAEALAAEPTIISGVYSDIDPNRDRNAVAGIELRLADGSDSQHVDFMVCDPRCTQPSRYVVRRGLGGVSFAHGQGAQAVDITIQPNGADSVIVSADWGRGLEQRRLPRVTREFGTIVARDRGASHLAR